MAGNVKAGRAGADYAAVIRTRRKTAGLSQEELAALLGVSRNTLAGWETGHSRPDLDRVPDLCRALKMPLGAFFGLKESRSAVEKRVLEKFLALEEGDREIVEWQMEMLAGKRAEKLRKEILYVTPEDLRRSAALLDAFAEKGSVCVVAPGELLDQCPDLPQADL